MFINVIRAFVAQYDIAQIFPFILDDIQPFGFWDILDAKYIPENTNKNEKPHYFIPM